MTLTTPSGRDTSPMLPPAGMGKNMPSLCPVEGRVVPPAGFMPGHRDRAEERKCRQLFIVGGGRANGLAPASGQDRANDLGQYLADLPERAVGVEVVVCVYEVNKLHDPKVRHGEVSCLKTRRGKELTPQIGVLARMTA